MKITVKDLVKSYHDADSALTVIDTVSFEFPERKSVAIIGRSGVGKSTMLQLLGGLDAPTSGSILWGDTEIASLDDDERSALRGRDVGFIFQFHHLLPEFSALENVAMPLIIQGVRDDEAYERASNVLERVGLRNRSTHRPHALSGGEQQRVAIARAIVGNPKMILADEPTGNLDLTTARIIQDLLIELNQELGNALIIVTHSRELAKGLDRMYEMQEGGHLVVV